FDTDCTHLFMFDADMTLHPGVIRKLLENDKDICGALCFMRYPPHYPVMFRKKSGNFNGKLSELFFDIIKKWEKDSVLEVDAIGTGVIMFKMDVFKKLKFPYFKRLLKAKVKGVEYRFGEDVSFCIKAKQAGYKIYMDTSIPCGHVCKFNIKEDDYKLATWLIDENKRIKGEMNKKMEKIFNKNKMAELNKKIFCKKREITEVI
ncbi:unnamed protein product, partial [marine sediment metagenome]